MIKKIPWSNGRYGVSDDGKVYSFVKRGNSSRLSEVPKEKKCYISNCGYLQVLLKIDGRQKLCLVHRLVAEMFVDNPNNLNEINHKDENKLNNIADNLEWCTRKYNQNYGTLKKRISEINLERAMVKQFICFDSWIGKMINHINEDQFDESLYRSNGRQISKTRRILQLDSDGNIVRTFNGLYECAEFFGLSVARISQICNNFHEKRKKLSLVYEKHIKN